MIHLHVNAYWLLGGCVCVLLSLHWQMNADVFMKCTTAVYGDNARLVLGEGSHHLTTEYTHSHCLLHARTHTHTLLVVH